MLDEMQQLRDNHGLFRLLAHYAGLVTEDKETWHDRLMELEGVKPPDLTRLHGQLLAYGWIEQNTGATPVLRAGAAPQCYRTTPAGRRSLRQAQADDDEAEAA